MEQTIELRLVDPKTLTSPTSANSGRSPPIACRTRLSRPTSTCVGSSSLRLFYERRTEALTIVEGAPPRPSAIANELPEIDDPRQTGPIPTTTCAPSAENVQRAPMLGSVSQLSS